MCEMTLSLPADPESEGEAAGKDNGALPKERMGASVASSADSAIDPAKIKELKESIEGKEPYPVRVGSDDFLSEYRKMVESFKAGLYRPASDMKLEWVKAKKFEKLGTPLGFNFDFIKELMEHGEALRESGLANLFSKVLRPPSPRSREYAEALRTQYNLFEESLKAAIERDRAKYSEPDFSFLHKSIEEWRAFVTTPPLTADAIDKFLADVRQITEAFSDFAHNSSDRYYFAGAEPLPGKGGGGLLRTIRVTFAYRKAVRKLERCVKQFKALIDEAYESSRQPDDTPKISDAIAKFKEASARTKRGGSKPSKQVGESGEEGKKDDKKETPPLPQPPPPPFPPRKDDDPDGDKRQLKPEYQETANNIADDIAGAIQDILSAAIEISFRNCGLFDNLPPEKRASFKKALLENMRDMLPMLGRTGGDSLYREINGRLSNLEQYLERFESKGVKVDVKSTKAISREVASQTAAKLKAESLVRPARKFFVDLKNMTDKQKQQHDIQVIWGIQRLDANSTTSSTFGIEEAARRAKKAGLLVWYTSDHSASVSYRKLKNNTRSDKWDEIAGCSPEAVAEIKARLDKYESGN